MNEQTIRSVLQSRVQEMPDRVFLADLETELTYRQVLRRVQEVANVVAGAGIEKGRSVGFAANNSIDLAIAILGLCYGGFRATAINLVAGTETLNYVLRHSDCRLILQDAAGASVLEAVENASALPRLAIGDIAVSANALEPAPVTADDDAILMYTSGTTGRPKGVRLSQANLLAGGYNTATAHQLAEDDRAMCSLPLYHINALCVTVMAPLMSGGSVVLAPKFSTSGFWHNIQATQCTWFSLVPTQIGYLLSMDEAETLPDMPQLRFGRSASAPLSPDVQSAFEERFKVPVIETMGLTETAAQILSNPLPPGIRKIGSPGIAFGNEVRIVNEQNEALAADTEGEICIRGSNVMLGYLNNETATKAAIDEQGWLHSGDLGKIDQDGYVFVTGRIKELIIKGGENIAPREIDEALLSHPAVLEAAAFAADCDRYGQTVAAAVVLKPDTDSDLETLLAHCKKKIGDFKSPQTIYFLDELPKGPSGKVQRLKLNSLLEGHGKPFMHVSTKTTQS